jgi:uncharacterized protein
MNHFLDFSKPNRHISPCMNKNLTFTASDGEKICLTTYYYEDCFLGNSIIFVHGFKGFKDWGFIPYLADYFAKKGFFTITFNFSHNGVKGNSSEFTELEKFSKNTFSREVRELKEIISAFRNNFFQNWFSRKVGINRT